MPFNTMINEYLAGSVLLASAIEGMTDVQLDAQPVADRWSTRQVVCHIADFEPIYADRMKRVIAEEQPSFLGGNPDIFAARLAYESRPVQDELELVAGVRRQMGTILHALDEADFQRTGHHPKDGPLTLATLLTRITDHLVHHVRFIEEKRQAL